MFMLKFIIIFFFVGNFIYSQVGIGTTDPKSSLDIYQQTGNNPQGVLIPRLSGDALKVMSLSLDQHSMLVYSLSAANSRMGTVAELIDSEGYYYYDSSINRFVKICSNSSSSPVMLKGVYVPGDYANKTKNDFDLQKAYEDCIWDCLYIKGIQTEAKTYICADTTVSRINSSTKNVKLIIQVFCEKSLLKYSKKGYVGNRPTILAEIIEEILIKERAKIDGEDVVH